MLKKCIILISMLLFFLVTTLDSKALVGNGFIWNKTDLEVSINETVENHLDEFKVQFYYNGKITDEEVTVELDRFYYGNLTISTNEVGDKKIKLIAKVYGYSSIDRKEVILRVVDKESPRIIQKKELIVNIGEEFNIDDYFDFQDNDKIDYIGKNLDRVNFTVPGSYPIELSASDRTGNTVTKNVSIIVVDRTLPVITSVPVIEIEYGNEGFNVSDYFKAYDNYDGDISQAITITGLNVYELGEQLCIINVVDSSENIKSIEKKIKIVDTESPSLELKCYKDTIMIEQSIDFKDYIESISDNYDQLSIDDVLIDTSAYKNELGKYNIYFEAKDSTGNLVKRKLELTVTYKEPPTIICDDIKIELGEDIDLYDYVSVTDEYDELVLESLEIYDEALNINKEGRYEIIVEATNKAGITAKKSFFVEVESSKSNFFSNDTLGFIYENKLIIIIAIGVISFGGYKVYMKRKKEV